MKHSLKIIIILLAMFLTTQFIGLFVISQYAPQVTQISDEQGNLINVTSYNIPYGMDPPRDTRPVGVLVSIVFAVAIAAFLMLLLMKYKAEVFLRIWFFVVTTLAIGLTLNAVLQNFFPIEKRS